ncbi:MAG TPA: hypothetical protein VGE77_07005 [Nocardioides sp.]
MSRRHNPVEARRRLRVLQYSVLVVLAIVTLVLCYLALTRTP